MCEISMLCAFNWNKQKKLTERTGVEIFKISHLSFYSA